MRFPIVALTLMLLIARPANSQSTPAPPRSSSDLTLGEILPEVRCSTDPSQSYALYVPPAYSPAHPWPLVISSDPGARGSVPLELQKKAAEQFGYILASSNNSRNGPWKPFLEASDAATKDVQARVSIDIRRIYFAGFSGGARASSQLATLCKCSAGLLLNGAGLSPSAKLDPEFQFPVFSAVGMFDFNYGEVIQLQDTLAKVGYPRWLRIFDGSHEWAPADVMKEAFAWFRIQAMKTQREPRDQTFIVSQFSEAQTRAIAFAQSGDLLSAWREYLQIAATFDSLADVSAIRAKADALGKDKAVREAAKREHNQFTEQASLTANITAGITSPNPPQDPGSLSTDIVRLRDMAGHEKRPERSRVYKRALSEVFIMAMDAGSRFLESKSYPRAISGFEAATEAQPDSEWAWRQLAASNAYANNSKSAIRDLRQARQLTKDVPAFDKWLNTESAFDRLRPTPEVQTLTRAN